MKKKKNLEIIEKKDPDAWDKTKIVIRTQVEIDNYNRLVGYRKARMKRYGKSATQRLKENSGSKDPKENSTSS
jgi:hypothetical protein